MFWGGGVKALSYQTAFLLLPIFYFHSLNFLFYLVLFYFLQQDVEKFTDIEKLYLYLKLPSGPSSGNDKRYWSSAISHTHTHAQTHLTQVFHFAPWRLFLFFCCFFFFLSRTHGCFVVALITFLALLSHCLSKNNPLATSQIHFRILKSEITILKSFCFILLCDIFWGVVVFFASCESITLSFQLYDWLSLWSKTLIYVDFCYT